MLFVWFGFLSVVFCVPLPGHSGLVGHAAPTDTAKDFVGAQHWVESGWYADSGFKSNYTGYFCLCSCEGTEQGIFCKGGGLHPDGSAVASFLGVFAQDNTGIWTGNLVAYETETPFADTFSMVKAGGPSNYTGVSQSLKDRSFVWRGTMSGVNCDYVDICNIMCHDSKDYQDWVQRCG
eukprot:c20972_g1_i1.p1 GENE.c20972_g1_i1~~c20972_g1_i1.p1  ORF type:complete len:178 (+),score=31.05 c20972_g1_i1:39-572(+)